MSIDMTKLPPADMRGYQVRQTATTLYISFERNFDTVKSSDHWAAVITRACVGPYHYIEVDVGNMVMISSTIIAGLVHLVDHFKGKGSKELCVANADDRIVRSLAMMKLEELFFFGSAEEAEAAP